MRTTFRVIGILSICFALPGLAQAQDAQGLGVNIPLVGRLTGGGGTLFITAIDVTNHEMAGVPIDFYLDGQEMGSSALIAVNGSIDNAGRLVPRGAGGVVRPRMNLHFDDFVESLIAAGLLPQSVRSNGFIGSALFVFGGRPRSGAGSVTARFYNALPGGGFVGVSVKGREVTNDEPTSLIAAVRDTRASGGVGPSLYPNLFINNMGMTPSGAGIAETVSVEISAIANSTGQPAGTPITLDLGVGRTAIIGDVLNALRVPTSSENTVLVVARVVRGNAAIQGLVSQVDNTTRDGAIFEMSRADY